MVDRLPIAVLAGIVGWCLGWASALLTDWLDPNRLSVVLAARNKLTDISDPLVQRFDYRVEPVGDGSIGRRKRFGGEDRQDTGARSSSVNPVDALLLLADRGCVRLFADFV
jgi:hypothetical protein